MRTLAVVAIVYSLLAGYVVFRYQDARRFPLRPLDLADAWVQAPGTDGYAGYFRYVFDLDSEATNAWVAIAACDGFEVTVNRDPVGRHYAWRPTRPFQNGFSEKGQRLSTTPPVIDLNFPREYQWSGHDSYRLPMFIDIRPELRRGRNVITVQIESRGAPARFALIGEITHAQGKTIPLKSGAGWRAAAVPPRQGALDWTEPNYDDVGWDRALATAPPPGRTWQTFDTRVFKTPFDGQLLESLQATSADSIRFRSQWKVLGQPRSAWIRLFATRQFDLFVNGQHICCADSFAPDADAGQWVIGREQAQDPQERPAVLDPDELDSPYVGHDFEQPPTGDPTRTNYRALPLSSRELRLRSTNSGSLFAEKYGSVWPRAAGSGRTFRRAPLSIRNAAGSPPQEPVDGVLCCLRHFPRAACGREFDRNQAG